MELYALIMAGGEGKRFWPLSSRENPKQFLSLTGEDSLIRQTVDRVLPIIPIEHIYIVTVERYAEQTRRHVPELPPGNLVLEPEGKNTAPCIAYGTLRINKTARDAVTVVLPADHAIGDGAAFRETIEFAARAASRRLEDGDFPLITLGVSPTSPETGYGYIKAGAEAVDSSGDYRALRVERFTEKPDHETALRFIREGGYYWNSGVFVWKASSILSELARILPAWRGRLGELAESLGGGSESAAVSSFYGSIRPGSIDKLVLEHSSHTAVIPVSFPWSDVGSWKSLDEYLRVRGDENIIRGKAVSVGSGGCLTIGDDRVIAIVGLRDIVVVDSKDGILVLDKEKSQDVRLVTEELGKLCKD